MAIYPELLNGVYGGAKAFVLALSQSLHHELGDKGVRIQAVLPGGIATDFWPDIGVKHGDLPPGTLMSVDDVVDAALAGFDAGELVTIPSLPDAAKWGACLSSDRPWKRGSMRKPGPWQRLRIDKVHQYWRVYRKESILNFVTDGGYVSKPTDYITRLHRALTM